MANNMGEKWKYYWIGLIRLVCYKTILKPFCQYVCYNIGVAKDI